MIDLHDIGEQRIEFKDELVLPVERLDPDLVAGPISVHLQGNVASLGDAYLVSGSLRAQGDLLCSRCLGPVAWSGEDGFSVELRFPEAQHADEIELGESEMDVIFLDSEQLDLTDLAAEQVTLSLPMRSLCRPDCAGLCLKCGANRNLGSGCSCEPETDPRWDALRALQEKPS